MKTTMSPVKKRFPAFLMTLVMLAACLSGLPISEGYASVTPTVTLADWTYGETPNDPVASGFAGPVSYTYYMYFSTSSGTPQDLTSSSADRGGADTDGGKPKNAQANYVVVASDGTNTAWSYFSIGQAEPAAKHFDFSAPANLAYDGSAKQASFAVKSGYTGMSDHVDITYYKDGVSSTNRVDAGAIDPGTYFVTLKVMAQGTNFDLNIDEVEDAAWTFTILPKELTVSGLTVSDKDYDGTTAATVAGTPTLTGVISGDDVTLSGTASAAFADASVGDGKQVSVSGLTLAGNDAAKYSLVSPALTASIKKRAVTVTAKDQSIQAGGKITEGPEQAILNGALSGHTLKTVVLTASSTQEATTSGTITPSEAKIQDSAGNDVTGNYQITYATGVLTVSKTDDLVEEVVVEEPVEQAQSWTVTFEPQNGGASFSASVSDGQTVSEPEDPKPFEGFEFIGWFLLENQMELSDKGPVWHTVEKEYDFSSPVTSDQRLVGRWKASKAVTLKVKESYQINLPENQWTYVSSLPKYVSVTSGGKVVALKEKKAAVIDVYLSGQPLSVYTIPVSVVKKSKIIINPVSALISGYGTASVQVTIEAADDYIESVWSENEKIATVELLDNNMIIITGKGVEGKTKVQIRSHFGAIKAIKVIVKKPAKKLKTIRLKVTGYGTVYSGVNFKSADDSIASVSSNNPEVAVAEIVGTDRIAVTTKARGKAKITVITQNGDTGTLVVAVKKPTVKISSGKAKISKSESTAFAVTRYYFPGDKIKSVVSSDKKIVTATFTGDVITVKGKGVGKATITVKTYSGAERKIKITVK